MSSRGDPGWAPEGAGHCREHEGQTLDLSRARSLPREVGRGWVGDISLMPKARSRAKRPGRRRREPVHVLEGRGAPSPGGRGAPSPGARASALGPPRPVHTHTLPHPRYDHRSVPESRSCSCRAQKPRAPEPGGPGPQSREAPGLWRVWGGWCLWARNTDWGQPGSRQRLRGCRVWRDSRWRSLAGGKRHRGWPGTQGWQAAGRRVLAHQGQGVKRGTTAGRLRVAERPERRPRQPGERVRGSGRCPRGPGQTQARIGSTHASNAAGVEHEKSGSVRSALPKGETTRQTRASLRQVQTQRETSRHVGARGRGSSRARGASESPTSPSAARQAERTSCP